MGNYQEACFITNYLHDEGVGYSIVEPVNHYKNFFLFGVLQKIFDMNTEEIPVVETTWVRQLIHSSPGLGGQNIYKFQLEDPVKFPSLTIEERALILQVAEATGLNDLEFDDDLKLVKGVPGPSENLHQDEDDGLDRISLEDSKKHAVDIATLYQQLYKEQLKFKGNKPTKSTIFNQGSLGCCFVAAAADISRMLYSSEIGVKPPSFLDLILRLIVWFGHQGGHSDDVINEKMPCLHAKEISFHQALEVITKRPLLFSWAWPGERWTQFSKAGSDQYYSDSPESELIITNGVLANADISGRKIGKKGGHIVVCVNIYYEPKLSGYS